MNLKNDYKNQIYDYIIVQFRQFVKSNFLQL
jgi:hypothetical protein